MGKRLYVGNVSYAATEESLRAVFEAVGAVERVQIMVDRETGRSRGFAFVDMADEGLVVRAVTELDGYSLGGRDLRVSEAKDRQGPRPAGGGGHAESTDGRGDRPRGRKANGGDARRSPAAPPDVAGRGGDRPGARSDGGASHAEGSRLRARDERKRAIERRSRGRSDNDEDFGGRRGNRGNRRFDDDEW
jgi:cold-inducible RNA-binding protein